MPLVRSILVLLLAALPALASAADKPRLLVVNRTAGFHHSSCEHAATVMMKIARRSNAFEVVFTDSVAFITPEALESFDGVLFANTTGDLKQFPLSEENRNALIEFVNAGGAFIGTHSATDTYKDWAPYYEMIGGSFNGHPWHEDVTIELEDPAHPAARMLPSPWRIKDEIYIFKNYSRDNIHVILRLKEAPVKGGHDVTKGDYPVAWCKPHGEGRVFYTSLGHREDVWDNPLYQEHLLAGIRWALKEDVRKSKDEFAAKLSVGHAPVRSEWTRIFNGESLNFGTDWETTDDTAKTRRHWTVQPGGILQGTWEKGSSHIYYVKRQFRNFEYRADVNIDPNGNSGMYFRCSPANLKDGKWKNWPIGYEAQINNGYDGDPKRSGTFYPQPTLLDKDIKRHLGYEKAKDDGNFWFNLHVIAVDDRFVVKLNGKVVVVHRNDAHQEGYFAFQMHHGNTIVKLKNIEVRELP